MMLTRHYYKDLLVHLKKLCCYRTFEEPVLYPAISQDTTKMIFNPLKNDI